MQHLFVSYNAQLRSRNGSGSIDVTESVSLEWNEPITNFENLTRLCERIKKERGDEPFFVDQIIILNWRRFEAPEVET